MVDPHAFMDALREFHHNHGEDLKAPIFNRRVMDLKKLWELVSAHGGSHQVCLRKRWASIGRCFNPPASMTNLSFHIKRIFERYLLPFEQLHFPDKTMKMQSDQSSQSSSSCASSERKCMETISPAFDHPVYIPKKKRSKLLKESKYQQQKKRKMSKSEGSKNKKTLFSRSINPKDFAMPQTLVRTSTALNVDDCEIQAASALQQMKGFPTLTNRFPPAVTPLNVANADGDMTIPPPSTSLSLFDQIETPVSKDDQLATANQIYLSNGIRVIPIKPASDGFFPIHVERPTPELRPTGLVPPSLPPLDKIADSSSSLEERQSKEIKRLKTQLQQMQSIILRQESKLQAAESSFDECRQRIHEIVATMTATSAPVVHHPPARRE